MDVGHLAGSQLIVHVQLRGRVAVHEVLLPVRLAKIADRAERHAAALQRLSERRPEVPVEVRVDERIQRAVEVAHPKHHRHHRIAALAAVAQGRDDVPVEEKISKRENW